MYILDKCLEPYIIHCGVINYQLFFKNGECKGYVDGGFTSRPFNSYDEYFEICKTHINMTTHNAKYDRRNEYESYSGNSGKC